MRHTHPPKIFRSALAYCLVPFLVLFLLLGLFSRPSQAHWADLSVGELHLNSQDLSLTLTLPTALVSSADDDHDNQLSNAEIDRHQTKLRQNILGDRLQFLSTQGPPKTLTLSASPQSIPLLPSNTSNSPASNSPAINPATHTTLQINATWDRPLTDLSMRYQLFIPGISTARCLLTILHQGKTQSLVFTPTQSEFSLLSPPLIQQVSSFIGLGIEHILTGYDHILFLVSLLIVSNSFGAVLKIVTAFTLSHSITLSLAALNLVQLPSQIVECAIALSIIYIAAENLWNQAPQHRWRLALGFGLIHGLGFAGILQDIHIPQSSLLLSLASFNLGVELGQMLIVGLCFGAFQLLKPFFQNHRQQVYLQRFVSSAIAAIGLVWFFERAFPTI
jgi:hydrogenase/urease accessory protein HupE